MAEKHQKTLTFAKVFTLNDQSYPVWIIDHTRTISKNAVDNIYNQINSLLSLEPLFRFALENEISGTLDAFSIPPGTSVEAEIFSRSSEESNLFTPLTSIERISIHLC